MAAAEPNGAIVKISKVVKTFQRGDEPITVLDQLDLEIPEGSFEALMGPSGSGKSTLLNLIAGLDRCTSGSVRVAERGVPARVLAVRPYAGQLEVEAAFLPHALPEGLEAPAIVRAAAPLHMALAPGAEIRLAAEPKDAFVFPCRDIICRA